MSYLNLRYLDICGSIVGLTYNGKRHYKSVLGGVLSIILFIGILCIIIPYSIDFFSRSKPKMSFEDNKYSSPPILNISEKFTIAVMTQYEGRNIIRDDVIKIDAIIKVKNGTQWHFIDLNQIPCTPNNRTNFDLFKKLELSKGACFNVSGHVLEGSQATDIFQFLQIRFNLCINQTGCLNKSEAIDLFDKAKPVALVYFIDTAFQIYNPTSRINNYYNYFDVNLTYSNNKESNVLISYNEMLVDNSYFFPTAPLNYSEFMIDTYRDKGALRSEKEITVLAINFMSSNYKSTIHISYMLFPEFLANVFSLINILLITIGTLANYFNHYLFQSDLMNSFYELDMEEDEGHVPLNDSGVFKSQVGNLTSVLQPKKTESCNLTNNYLNFKESKLFTMIPVVPLMNNIPYQGSDQSVSGSFVEYSKQNKYFKYQRGKHRFGHTVAITMQFVYMFSCCCGKKMKEKEKKFTQINQSLCFYQDLKNAFRKLMEIDLLKFLLLSEEQLALYHIVPKPHYQRLSDAKNTKIFSALINNPRFHFLKSKVYIQKAINFPEYKTLLVNKKQVNAKRSVLDEKLVKLITN